MIDFSNYNPKNAAIVKAFDALHGEKWPIPDPCKDEAIVRIMDFEGEKRLWLESSINRDANNPIQIEEYSSLWTIPAKYARSRMLVDGFYDPFMEINDKVSGGITLIDGQTEEDTEKYLSRAAYRMSRTDFIWYMEILAPGSYLVN